jgi:hypothetical protein
MSSKRSMKASGSSNSESDSTRLIMGAIENSLKIMTEKLDKQEQIILSLTNENKALLSEITILKDNQCSLKKTVDDLTNEMNEFKQEKLNCDIIVTNIPTDCHVDPTKLVDEIVHYYGVNKEEIAEHYGYIRNRPGGNGKYHNVVIKCTSPEAQRRFLLLKKSKGSFLYHQEFRPSSNVISDKEIFINARLTNFNLELLREARMIRKAGGVKYAWQQHGNILVRQVEGGSITKIKQMNDFLPYAIEHEDHENSM